MHKDDRRRPQRPVHPRRLRDATNRELQDNLASALAKLGRHQPKVVRIDSLPKAEPNGSTAHEAVYPFVFRLLTNEAPRQPASAFRSCSEDHALALLYACVRSQGACVSTQLDLDDRGGEIRVRVPSEYGVPASVLQGLKEMLPLDPGRRTCFWNVDQSGSSRPVDPSPKIDVNELLLVFYDPKRVVTLYWVEMID